MRLPKEGILPDVLAEDGAWLLIPEDDMSPSNELCMDGGSEMGLLAVTELDNAFPFWDVAVPLNAEMPIRLLPLLDDTAEEEDEVRPPEPIKGRVPLFSCTCKCKWDGGGP